MKRISSSSLKQDNNEEKHSADGMIMNLISLGLSDHELQVFLNIGCSRITRLRRRLNAGDNWRPFVRPPPIHKMSQKSVDCFQSFFSTLEVEVNLCVSF